MNNLSVIIPAHNSETTIARAINSIDIECEIIVIADHCKDNTVSIVKSLHKKNLLLVEVAFQDPGLSREIGVKKSSCSYISFLDADDEFLPGKLNKQIKFMINNNINWSSTKYKVIFENSKYSYFVKPRKLITYKGLLRNCDIGNSTVIILKDLLPKEFPKRPKEDWRLWLEIASMGNICHGLEICGTYYYRSQEQDSSSYLNNYVEKINVFRSLGYSRFKITWFLIIDLVYQIKRRMSFR